MLLANTRGRNKAFAARERFDMRVRAIQAPKHTALMAMASATPGLLTPQFISMS